MYHVYIFWSNFKFHSLRVACVQCTSNCELMIERAMPFSSFFFGPIQSLSKSVSEAVERRRNYSQR